MSGERLLAIELDLLQDKRSRSWVAGGGKGIGKATCHRLAAEGAAKVVVADLDLQAAQKVVADLQRDCDSVVAAQVRGPPSIILLPLILKLAAHESGSGSLAVGVTH